MAKDEMLCPRKGCQQPLSGRVCKHCDLDLDDLFVPARPAPEEIFRALAAAGAFIDRGSRSLVIPGSPVWNAVVVSPDSYTPGQAERMAECVREVCNLPVSKYGRNEVQALLHHLFSAAAESLPRVDGVNGRPQLFLHEGQLLWPFTDSVMGRFFETVREDGSPAGFKYTGPMLQPEQNGAFEEFLSSCRCATEDDRDMLRAWMLAATVPTLIPYGQAPMLMVAAAEHGTGKTAMASVIANMFGVGLSIYWRNGMRLDDLNRMILGNDVTAAIVDNITAPPQAFGVFDSPTLAQYITQEEVATKKLYSSKGSCVQSNYYLFIGTANKPIFSSELLSRIYPVTISKTQPAQSKWIETWKRRSAEVVADLLWTAQPNWEKGFTTTAPRGYRYATWYEMTARLLGRPPVILPATSVVRSPMEVCLDRMWERNHWAPEVPITTVVEAMEQEQFGLIAVVREQSSMDADSLAEHLALYSRKYQVVDSNLRRTDG